VNELRGRKSYINRKTYINKAHNWRGRRIGMIRATGIRAIGRVDGKALDCGSGSLSMSRQDELSFRRTSFLYAACRLH